MLVLELIKRAINRSLTNSFYDEDSSTYNTTALELLLDIQDELRDVVPYYQEYTYDTYADLSKVPFTFVSGIKYYLGSVSYVLASRELHEFQAFSSVKNLKAPPVMFYFDDITGLVSVYPEPYEDINNIIVWGILRDNELDFTSPLPSIYPRFFNSFLTQELAYRLSCEFNVEWSPARENLRKELKKKVYDYGRRSIPNNTEPLMSNAINKQFPATPIGYYL